MAKYIQHKIKSEEQDKRYKKCGYRKLLDDAK